MSYYLKKLQTAVRLSMSKISAISLKSWENQRIIPTVRKPSQIIIVNTQEHLHGPRNSLEMVMISFLEVLQQELPITLVLMSSGPDWHSFFFLSVGLVLYATLSYGFYSPKLRQQPKNFKWRGKR